MSSPVLLSSFTPSTMAPETLEAIFVKREPLAERIVGSLTAAVVDGDIEHHLVVGPRGMGKTHLLTIAVNRLRDRDLGDALTIAWLREEEWGVTNLGELYEQVLQQLAADPTGDSTLRDAARSAADGLLSVDPENLAAAAEGHLTELLAGRRLVVVVENLDQIFDSIGEDDQHQLRAYLQTHRNMVLLASSPTLSPSIATRQGLFFGFFAIHHLEELTVDEARDLLLRIAELHDDEESRRLRAYLPTDEATNRLEVVARIAGGHPRLWVLMSECISTERLDEVVTLLHALLDDLTPYYHAQMASLSGQQRKIVTTLARTDGALLVKDVATRTRMAPNAAAKHIGDLVKLGFVRPAFLPEGAALADRRSKAYELREPLLRHSLELKESRGEPLRLIVAILRAWFPESRLRELNDASRGAAASYLRAALVPGDAERREIEDLVGRGRDRLARGDAEGALVMLDQAALFDHASSLVQEARHDALLALGRFDEAIDAQLSISRAEVDPRQDIRTTIIAALHDGALPTAAQVAPAFDGDEKPSGSAATSRFLAVAFEAAAQRPAKEFSAALQVLLEACPPQQRALAVGSAVSAGFLGRAGRDAVADRQLWQSVIERAVDAEEIGPLLQWISFVNGFLETGDAAWLLRLPTPVREIYTPGALTGTRP